MIPLLFFSVVNANAQAWVAQENTIETNWNYTLQMGTTALISEVNTDFGTWRNDMNNMLDFAINMQLGKMFWKRFDFGLNTGYSRYKGYQNSSTNINWLMLHPTFNNDEQTFLPYSINYDSDIIDFSLYAKYNFINFSTWTTGFLKLNLYVKLALGIALPSTELRYTDISSYDFSKLPHPLYSKGRYPNYKRSVYSLVSPAFGLNYQLSDRIFISAESSLQLVGIDYIDGIQNYNNQLTPDVPIELAPRYRDEVFGLTTKIMFGATYFFNFSSYRKDREKLFPFYANRYRSYYSQYQKPSTKKARQEHLPFFKLKMKD